MLALVVAVGTAGPARADGKPPASQPALDALLDQLSRVDRKTLEAHLNKLRAEHRKLADRAAGLRKQLQQVESQAAAVQRRIRLLEVLLKPSGKAPAKSPAVAAKPKRGRMAPKPGPPQMSSAAASAAPKPAQAAKPAAAVKPRPSPAGPANTTKTMLARKPAKRKLLNYQDHIQPILIDRCGGCHNQDEARGGLVVDDFELLMAGGSSGEVIVPGDPAGSRLWRMINHQEQPYMPKDAPKLEAKLLATIRTWIEQGAPADAKAAPAAAKASKPKPAAPAAAPAVVARGPVMPPADLSALRPPTTRPAAVTALAASPTSLLVAISGHRQVLLLHAGQNRLRTALPFKEGRIERLQFSPDGLWLLVAGGLTGKRGVVAIYDVATAKRIVTLGRMYDSVLAAAIDPYRELVAAGGSNRIVRVYDLLEGNAVAYEIRKHNEWITAVAFSPDATLLATADRAGALYVWEADTGRLVHVLSHGAAIRALAFGPDSRLLASTGDDGMVRLWDMDNGRRARQFRASGSAVLCLDIAPDGRILAGGQDQRLRLFDPGGKTLRQFAPADDWIYAACFADGGRRIYAGSFSGQVCVYEPGRDQPIARVTTNPPRPGSS